MAHDSLDDDARAWVALRGVPNLRGCAACPTPPVPPCSCLLARQRGWRALSVDRHPVPVGTGPDDTLYLESEGAEQRGQLVLAVIGEPSPALRVVVDSRLPPFAVSLCDGQVQAPAYSHGSREADKHGLDFAARNVKERSSTPDAVDCS